ncbi:MAG: hypothetical protein IT371_23595 [Deltaproteobacteria bacterium]|nr:hypothetical protein [Deltaproteobacteria bacterium]
MSRALAQPGASLAAHLRRGKGAIDGVHRTLIEPKLDGSVNLEVAWAGGQREGERLFDYLAVVADGCALKLIEVHPASSTGAVQEVIEKKQGTEAIAARSKVSLEGGSWHWLVPGKGSVTFTANDGHGKRLALAGIVQPRRRLAG